MRHFDHGLRKFLCILVVGDQSFLNKEVVDNIPYIWKVVLGSDQPLIDDQNLDSESYMAECNLLKLTAEQK